MTINVRTEGQKKRRLACLLAGDGKLVSLEPSPLGGVVCPGQLGGSQPWEVGFFGLK